uniref:E3 ubiquitin-protein ligase n=1 Tax=Heterorhabditis bacteriophora TaxID=37862 RepID=A0A1I7XAB5_HETBA
MATLVASAGGEPAAADQQTADSPRRSARTERMQKEEEVRISGLNKNFMNYTKKYFRGELAGLLTDLVRDCMLCQSSNVLRDAVSGELLGVCLASKAALFEKQMDRLFRYEFNDIKLRIVIEFLKSVFNRSDVAYHLEENRITKPVFVPLLAVRSDCWNQGMATMMLESWLEDIIHFLLTSQFLSGLRENRHFEAEIEEGLRCL